MTSPATQPACSTPFTSSSSLATLSMRCVAASSKTPWVTVDARGDPLYQIRLLLRASRDRLTKRQKERLRAAFTADEAHISVEVACHCAQQVRDVFHQDTPAQGQRLATRLVERLPTCPIPEIARLGRTLRKWKDAHLAYFDTAEANNAPHRSRQRNHRTRQTHRQSLPQPHQLPAPNAPHRRRPRRLHPHSTLKSRITPRPNPCVPPSQPSTTTGVPSPTATRSTPGLPPGSKTSTTAAASTPASAADPPLNTNYTKRPGQQPHQQTADDLHTGPTRKRHYSLSPYGSDLM